jgi:outer membrane protein assembly factor BamA
MFAVARFEADFPLGLPEEYGITGGAFLDVGSVWSLDNTAGPAGSPSTTLQAPRRGRSVAVVEHADRPVAVQLLEGAEEGRL